MSVFRWSLILISLSVGQYLAAQDQSWQRSIDQVFAHEHFKHAQVSCTILDLDGRRIYAYDDDVALIPASTHKILTTISTLNLLGEDYRYGTEVGFSGDLASDGTLYGDLVIRGSGDPSLGNPEDPSATSMDSFIVSVVRNVERAGITCIDGMIIIDHGVFDQQIVHPSWPWDDLTNYYASGAWGFNIRRNAYDIYFQRSDAPDLKTKVQRVEPEVPHLTLANHVKTGPKGSGDNAYLFGDPYDTKRQIHGTIPPGTGLFEIHGALPDPGDFFAFHLSNHLKEAKIEVRGFRSVFGYDQKIKTLFIHYSPHLKAMIKHANIESDNLYCEAFLKTCGLHAYDFGSYRTGVDAVKANLAKSGFNLSSINYEDGSGLSMRNRISAFTLAQFVVTQSVKNGIQQMKAVLPGAGSGGSVSSFLRGKEVQQYAWLKSGSMSSVQAYAGFLDFPNGETFVLAIMSNGHQVSNRRIRAHFEKVIDTFYKAQN